MQHENRRASDLSDILVLMNMRYTNPRSDSLYSRACKRVVNVKDQFSQKKRSIFNWVIQKVKGERFWSTV